MLIKVPSVAYSGLDTVSVDVEINVASRGLPGFDLVGLATKAVEESRERVRAAIVNSKVKFPQRKITVNLAPADIPKEGSLYDLPIATGIIAAVLSAEIPDKSLFFGELSLDGTLRHTKGAVLVALFAKQNGYEHIFVPRDCANEASVVHGVNVYAIDSLEDIVHLFKNNISYIPQEVGLGEVDERAHVDFDMEEILGQDQTKRGMEIAAAGGHNILMVGSPGSGKTMLARALPGILPPLQDAESLEVTKIYSISGQLKAGSSLVRVRPFRSPHHSISPVGLIGGGQKPQPGEVSLSHRGVLFLDEFNEFPRSVLEALRQPVEDGHVSISRSRSRVTYPSRFMLVASANPCPCGYLNHSKKPCVCSPREVKRYKKRASGPLLDRIDIHVDVPEVDIEKLSGHGVSSKDKPENSLVIRERVLKARELQGKRFEGSGIHTNSEMSNKLIKKHGNLSEDARVILTRAASSFQLSARAYMKMIKIARTIADIEESENIEKHHMAEALQYRPKAYEEGNEF